MTAVAWSLKPVTPLPAAGRLLDLKPALGSRTVPGYSLAHGCHCFELHGLRAWLIAFWAFVVARGDAPLGAVAVSSIITLLAMPASILGIELVPRLVACLCRHGGGARTRGIVMVSRFPEVDFDRSVAFVSYDPIDRTHGTA